MSEQIYDTQIAPLLAQAGELCVKHRLPLVAQVEYTPGQFGATAWLGESAGLVMHLMLWAAGCKGNVDLLIMKIAAYGREHGHSSAILKVLETLPEGGG